MPMTKLPSKARPWFVSAQAEDTQGDAGATASDRSSGAQGAYGNTRHIAEQ